jgi:putative cell wall-binding protein
MLNHIYKIYSTINDKDFFIGITESSDIHMLYIHKTHSKKNIKKNKLYKFINDNYENIKCQILESRECIDKDNINNYLYESIEKYKPTLNLKVQRINDMKEYQKAYRSKNKSLMNKEKRKEYNKKYSEKKKSQCNVAE